MNIGGRGYRLTVRVIALVLVAVTLTAVAACSSASSPEVSIVSNGGRKITTVKVEIANTNTEREIGLMYRRHLDANAGMLFVFSRPQHLNFWMKNTEIPLDMIFADSQGRIVGIVARAVPFSEQNLSVVGDSQYVLEVNGGFCALHGIKSGDILRFVGFVPHALD